MHELYDDEEETGGDDLSDEPYVDDDYILRRYSNFKFYRKILAIVVIAFFVGVFIAPELARDLLSVLTGPKTPDYLQLVSDVDQNGQFLRFDPGVVRYRISGDASITSELADSALRQAAAGWEKCLDGHLRFEATRQEGKEELLIELKNNLPQPGRTYLEFQDGMYRPRVEIDADRLSDPTVFTMIMAHELGHAMGIWGHSDYVGDLMYPAPERMTPSKRDRKTIRLLYGLDGLDH